MKFLKSFGFGLLYAILLPFLILGAAIIGVYGLGIAIYNAVKLLIGFFKGETGFPKLEEDIQAEQIRQARVNATWQAQVTPPAPQPAPTPSAVYVQQNYYQAPQTPQQPINQSPYPQTPIDAPHVEPTPLSSPQEPPLIQEVQAEKQENADENPFKGLEDDLL